MIVKRFDYAPGDGINARWRTHLTVIMLTCPDHEAEALWQYQFRATTPMPAVLPDARFDQMDRELREVGCKHLIRADVDA